MVVQVEFFLQALFIFLSGVTQQIKVETCSQSAQYSLRPIIALPIIMDPKRKVYATWNDK